tara:strand:- start:108 stop:1217 length:1110 start_codon:yes stop_codon:yes gene_type:complete
MWNYYNPVKIIFGENKFRDLYKFTDKKKYIIITSKSIFEKYSKKLISSKNPPLKIIKDVKPNPDYTELLSLINKFSNLSQKIDLILAIGGGSVIDSAKVLAAFKDNKKLLTDFVRGNKHPKVYRPIDIIAVPTTSGSSSELTCWATIWDRELCNKLSFSDLYLYPKIAIIDPTIALDKSKSLTISTGLDVLSHSMESIWNINANPISAFHAVIAARMIIKNLPKLIKDLQNLELRTNVARACVHAGLAFSNTRTAIAHNISYPITLKYGLQHGIASSFSLPIILKSMEGVNKEAEIRLQEIFNDNLNNSASKLESVLRKLDVPLNLNELAINKNDWEKIVADAFLGERGKNFLGNKSNFDKALNASNFF